MTHAARHLPATPAEVADRGWDAVDVVLVTGDAHVDHPSFPAALLGRVLEADGWRVAVISRPDFRGPDDIARFGAPRLFFGVTAGALDSLVGNYTAAKRRRADDPYAPGGLAGGRPDRAVTVYANLIRRAFGKSVFIVAGGLEASLRRFAHYDYWSDSVRRSLLMDCGADVLVHGMGEGPILAIARRLADLADRPFDSADRVAALRDVPGVVYRVPRREPPPDAAVALPTAEDVAADPVAHARAHHLQETNRERVQWQDNGGMRVIANPAWPPLDPAELDRVYALPFTRDVHPSQRAAGVPALTQVRFAVTSHRGCGGGCAFCSIGTHQGKTIASRSPASILAEVERIAAHPEFRGTVTDIGGPTANMYGLGCTRSEPCARVSCLWPRRCRHLRTDQEPYRRVLAAARAVLGVKHVFVTTGVRTDLAVLAPELVRQLAEWHTSGHMKVAPEHVVPAVLDLMRKPGPRTFDEFLRLHRRCSADVGREQYVLPYMMAAHPGCRIEEMDELRRFLVERRLKVEQCQVFTPTPGTAATVMYATGLDPATLEPVFVERDPQCKEEQKAMILHHLQRPARRPRGDK